MSETIEKFNKHVMQTYGRLPIVLEKGHNDDAVDENGKEYIDFGSGIGTNSLGYCNDKWADAVCAQARAIQHTSNYFYTKVQADFAAKLCELTGYTDVFFGNSGAEANECAIKLARKYSFDKYGKCRHTIALHAVGYGTGRVPQLLLPLCGGLCERSRQRYRRSQKAYRRG